jgi:hypothetical protein
MGLFSKAVWSFEYMFEKPETRGTCCKGAPGWMYRPLLNYEVDAYMNCPVSSDFGYDSENGGKKLRPIFGVSAMSGSAAIHNANCSDFASRWYVMFMCYS